MADQLTEEEMISLESVGNTLRGMTFDLRIPVETRACLADLARDVDKITDRLNEALDDEDEEPDPDILLMDLEERRRLAKEYGDDD